MAIRNGALFGGSNETFFLDDVVCLGNESNLLQCGHNAIGIHDCDPSQSAGVICGGV